MILPSVAQIMEGSRDSFEGVIFTMLIVLLVEHLVGLDKGSKSAFQATYLMITQALIWTGMQDQNAQWGAFRAVRPIIEGMRYKLVPLPSLGLPPAPILSYTSAEPQLAPTPMIH